MARRCVPQDAFPIRRSECLDKGGISFASTTVYICYFEIYHTLSQNLLGSRGPFRLRADFFYATPSVFLSVDRFVRAGPGL